MPFLAREAAFFFMRRSSPFKSIIAIFIAAVIGFFLPFSAMRSPIKADAASGSTTVYITEYGEKYHSYSCQYLRQSCIAISLSRAVERGYDKLDEEIKKEYAWYEWNNYYDEYGSLFEIYQMIENLLSWFREAGFDYKSGYNIEDATSGNVRLIIYRD